MIESNSHYTDRTFEEVDLNATRLVSSQFNACTFVNCSFVETVLLDCRFIECKFKDCDMSLLQVSGSVVSGTTFEDSKLVGINWTHANWGTNLLQEPLAFARCVLNHSTFIGLTLAEFQFKDCIASDVDFREADLSQSMFEGTDLSESFFSQTNLTQADLSRARNYTINPEENTLKGAKFSLPEAMSLLFSMNILLIDPNE
ncbi:MAG: pentapeptide repeat-containing protein [Anaerolineales bacterium]|nr:pentapeptide repeat-containing protein [Chloroflexota bacterium]MBL6981166.1 pentapeptide repeat-containing protein [Anaerolineales bacterium]